MTPRERFRSLLRGSLLGACPKRLGYMALAPVVDDTLQQGSLSHLVPSENPRFDDGHWHEFDIKRRMVAADVKFEAGLHKVLEISIPVTDDWVILGHYDGLIRVPQTDERWLRQGRHLFEAKSSIQALYWKYVKGGYQVTFPSYYDQLQGYLHGTIIGWTDIDDEHNPVRGLYGDIGGYEIDLEWITPATALVAVKNKESGSIWTELINADADHFWFLQQRWIRADECIANDRLPERLYEDNKNYECRQCPFATECWASEVAIVDPMELDTPEIRESVRIYRLGKTLQQFGEHMMELVETQLTPNGLGRYDIEGMRITQYPMTRTTWNYKELEKLLSKEQLDQVRVTRDIIVVRRDADQVSATELREALLNTPQLLLEG